MSHCLTLGKLGLALEGILNQGAIRGSPGPSCSPILYWDLGNATPELEHPSSRMEYDVSCKTKTRSFKVGCALAPLSAKRSSTAPLWLYNSRDRRAADTGGQGRNRIYLEVFPRTESRRQLGALGTRLPPLVAPSMSLLGACHHTHQLAPGERLPLPLPWSHAEDIRLRPIVGNQHRLVDTQATSLWHKEAGEEGLGAVATSGRQLPSPGSAAGMHGKGRTLHEFSDCSVLVPVAR